MANPIAPIDVLEDSGAFTIDLDTVFEDPDDETLIYRVRSNSQRSVLESEIQGSNIELTPVADQSAPVVSIRVEAEDPTGLIVTHDFEVQIDPVNDVPVVIVPNPSEFLEDTAGTLTIDATAFFDDVDIPFGDSLTYAETGITGDPVFVAGSVSVSPGGVSVIYSGT